MNLLHFMKIYEEIMLLRYRHLVCMFSAMGSELNHLWRELCTAPAGRGTWYLVPPYLIKLNVIFIYKYILYILFTRFKFYDIILNASSCGQHSW